MTNLKVVAEGLRFPEGPVCLPDGSVVVVEARGGTIARIDPGTGRVERIATTGGGPNGAALGPDGLLYVCNNGGLDWIDAGPLTIPGHQPADYSGGRIQRVDLATGAVEDLYVECDGFGLRGPNDLVLDGHGGLYFTDSGKTRAREVDAGGLYYARCDGSSIRAVAYPMEHPNGVGLSPAGDVLYVSETITARVWAFHVAGPGEFDRGGHVGPDPLQLSVRHLVISLPNFQLIDSLAVEAGGNVCLAVLAPGGLATPGIAVVSRDGELVEFVDLPASDPLVTNICFGGPDLRTAYVTSSGRGLLYELAWEREGLRLAGDAQAT